VHGVGLDLLEIDRLEAALARRPGLAERLFTEGEREYAATRGRPGQLHGDAAARAAELGVEVRISLTHSRGLAGAVAVLQ
jgi:holo-[acyl-carrier protein] synthase